MSVPFTVARICTSEGPEKRPRRTSTTSTDFLLPFSILAFVEKFVEVIVPVNEYAEFLPGELDAAGPQNTVEKPPRATSMMPSAVIPAVTSHLTREIFIAFSFL